MLVKAPSDRIIRVVLNNVITGCEGVGSLTSLQYSITSDRQMSVAFKAVLADGTTFDSTQYSRFVVDLNQLD